ADTRREDRGVGVTGGARPPADRLAVTVGEQPGRRAVLDHAAEVVAVAPAPAPLEVAAADPVEHAPAALGVAGPVEHGDQVVPAFPGQRVDLQLGLAHMPSSARPPEPTGRPRQWSAGTRSSASRSSL